MLNTTQRATHTLQFSVDKFWNAKMSIKQTKVWQKYEKLVTKILNMMSNRDVVPMYFEQWALLNLIPHTAESG